jgi:uncharacterized protein YebE (UPF0316 family)
LEFSWQVEGYMAFDFNDLPVGWLALLVFLSRVMDVSIGTIRMIATVQGRIVMAFVLGIFEVTIWLVVIATVVNTVLERPWLLLFYALGYSTGNVAGIVIERKLALGHGILRIITSTHAQEIFTALIGADFRVTRFEGEGARGPVSEIYVVCDRRRLAPALKLVQAIDPDVFYLCETPTRVRRYRGQMVMMPEGIKSLLKRK